MNHNKTMYMYRGACLSQSPLAQIFLASGDCFINISTVEFKVGLFREVAAKAGSTVYDL